MEYLEITEENTIRLKNYIKYIPHNVSTLRNEVLWVLQSKNLVGISSKIEEECIIFFSSKKLLSLDDLNNFIESLDLNKIILK